MRDPKLAYLLLWYPLPSETFIFREVENLKALGLEIKVYSLYGPALNKLSPQMAKAASEVTRLGIKNFFALASSLFYWLKREPAKVSALLKEIPFRRWRDLEMFGESLWAFFCGFHLARLFSRDGVKLIHSPWASGPATAAWVASKLTGIPFCFSARAGDIYPEDGALPDKLRDCLFARVNNAANIKYLASLAPKYASKVELVYNSLTLPQTGAHAKSMRKPLRILALGRFARTKGYDVLLKACALLRDANFDFRLTLAGDGYQKPKLKYLTWKYKLGDLVDYPGFVTHDQVAGLMAGHDVFVMPSVIYSNGDRDGIPNVIMEALAHGLPVVASDVCGISEVIEDGLTGLLVPQRDPQTLAGALRRMAREPQAAGRMAENGRERVLRMFDSEANTRALLGLYLRRYALSRGQELS